MKKLFVLLVLMLAAFAGCNSSTGNDDKDNGGDTGNNTGNGGKYTVSGSARLTSASGAAIAGATVVLASTSQTATIPLTTTTGSNGAFSFGNISAGSYIVTIEKENHTFSPEFVMVTVADKNVVVQTFVGTTVNTSGNAGSVALYPFKTNATWTYDSVYEALGFPSNQKVVQKVTGTMNMGGKTYWAVKSTTYDSEGEEDGEDTLYFRVDNNIMYGYGTDFLTGKIAKAAKPGQAAAIFKPAQSISSEYPLIKFGVAAGTTWDIYKDSGAYQSTSWNILATGKYVGTETVSSYSNCARYELSYASETNSSFGKIASKSGLTIWLAPNVGPVKTVLVTHIGDSLDAVSLLSTVTNTLNTVQIP
jgi:hypothetical protein